MRSIVLVAAAILPLTFAAAQQKPGVSAPKKCKPTGGLVEHKPDGPTRARPLGEMPPAVEIKTVWRVVDGCPQPVVVRRGIGAPAAAPRR